MEFHLFILIFSGQVVYKPWVLSVFSEALVPIIRTILIPAADCMLLLHQPVIGPVTVHFSVMVLKRLAMYYTHYIKCFANWVCHSVPAGIRTRLAGSASRLSTLQAKPVGHASMTMNECECECEFELEYKTDQEYENEYQFNFEWGCD